MAAPLRADLTPEARLESGIIAFRAQDYASAEPELSAAALALQSALTPGSPSVMTYERALMYLALAQFRLNREDDARATVQRLFAAESVDPVYASLPLAAETVDFETLAAALVPDTPLPKRNLAGTVDDPSVPLPPVVRAPAPEPTPAPIINTPPVIETTPPPPPPIRSVVVPAATAANLTHFAALRQADALAAEGQSMEALRIWETLSAAPDAPREVLIEAAIGLYRIGAYRQAVAAFDRLGSLGRGEEDLRYYHAVVLYETGNYELARKELACALPFIQVTDEVERYRLKINQPST
ncbi:MAG TPA: hypothetical protein VJZ00_09240 [Thermoanaerobaculia bacterium]|nr:hypothetical protein [Thermoanaerobaculia bacterium]